MNPFQSTLAIVATAIALNPGASLSAEIDPDEIAALRKDAEQGNAVAQFLLGIHYDEGEGVPEDKIEAARWIRRAAEQGIAEAQRNLASRYFKGEGVAQDKAECAKWFRMAAEQGHAEAQFCLSSLYSKGDGVPQDAEESVSWVRKAAEQDYGRAQWTLGMLYFRGYGVPKDETEAARWVRKAAEEDSAQAAEARQFMGLLYSQGVGVRKDDVQSYKWTLLAASRGNEEATKRAAAMKLFLTRAQLTEGQRLANEFEPRLADGQPPMTSTASTSKVTSVPSSPSEQSGTGFFVTEKGYLVTNAHVVRGADSIRVLTKSGFLQAEIVRLDEANDLALLKAEGVFASVPIAASRSVRLGSTVATVGFPNIGIQGFAPKLAKGEIASMSGAQDDPRHFQISVPLQPGNSGGPLVDERGNVVGVLVAKLNQEKAFAATGAIPENVSYAVKSSYLLGFLEAIPEVVEQMKEPTPLDRRFEDVVSDVENATVLVLAH